MKLLEVDIFSKILAGIVIGMTILAVIFAYNKLVIERDFWVKGMVPCDPLVHSCFVHYCDPEIEHCQDGEEDIPKYYAFIWKNYKDIARCNPATEDCPIETCQNSDGCEITYCKEGNTEGLECVGEKVENKKLK